MNSQTLYTIVSAAIWSGIAAGCYGFIFNAEKKDVPWGALLGAAGWSLYLIFKAQMQSDGWGYIIGSFAVAAGSEILAYSLKRPATIFLVPGIIPLVPGGGIYSAMHEMVQGNFDNAVRIGYAALIAAGAIALGIAVSSSIARILIKLRKKHHLDLLRKAEKQVSFYDIYTDD
ncbi:MAG: threonine/serine exporter family protein [Treponema sp.]|nr:threonine/serine exporter family protein [Treponema sp.]